MKDRKLNKCPEGICNKYDMKAAIMEYASPMIENMFSRLHLSRKWDAEHNTLCEGIETERGMIFDELVAIMWLGLEMSHYDDFDFFEELENTIRNIEREHRQGR